MLLQILAPPRTKFPSTASSRIHTVLFIWVDPPASVRLFSTNPKGNFFFSKRYLHSAFSNLFLPVYDSTVQHGWQTYMWDNQVHIQQPVGSCSRQVWDEECQSVKHVSFSTWNDIRHPQNSSSLAKTCRYLQLILYPIILKDSRFSSISKWPQTTLYGNASK